MTKILVILTFLSLMFIVSSHPLTLTLIILLSTTAVALYSGSMSLSYWYSFMLFMIMIGGMLVLVIYMTSIASNEMFENPWKYLMIMIMMMVVLMITSTPMATSIYTQTPETIQMMMAKENLSLGKFINPHHMKIIIVLINYLLITLIAIVKITNIKYGSLRQKF